VTSRSKMDSPVGGGVNRPCFSFQRIPPATKTASSKTIDIRKIILRLEII